MSDPGFSVRVRRFMTNPLLQRKQFCLDVVHPARGLVAKSSLKEKLAKQYRVTDPSTIILFGFKAAFGGGRSTGFGLIYDNLAAVKKFEHKYRLVRHGLETAVAKPGRRSSKEAKNRMKKVRGKEKTKAKTATKK
eukprot:GHVT01059184.1.p2 GENE.GHVT01059184.1~~GHVT01059184.1.p2  ORF type:complete len:135 (+),score=31.35 GHVT01059184.1:427-831(+)